MRLSYVSKKQYITKLLGIRLSPQAGRSKGPLKQNYLQVVFRSMGRVKIDNFQLSSLYKDQPKLKTANEMSVTKVNFIPRIRLPK